MTDDAIDRALGREIERRAMPGAAWWVGTPEGAASDGCVGAAALEGGRLELRPDMPFDLASLTKPLATALLAVLFDREGRLSLDAPLRSVFRELHATPWAATTLRDAGVHRSGLPAWRPLYLAGSRREDYIAAISRLQPEGPIGETLYSDLGYILLGIALERAVGERLDRLFDAHIARPLHLGRCGFAGTSDRFADAAATEHDRSYERTLAGEAGAHASGVFEVPITRGRVHDGNAWGLGGIAGHAGLFAPAADVAAIAAAILEPSRLGLPAGALDALLIPDSQAPHARTVGFQRAQDAESACGLLPDDAVGHTGFTGTSLWLDPESRRIYVLLTNRVHPRVPEAPFAPVRRAFHAAALGAR